jgi:hypothetical protein
MSAVGSKDGDGASRNAASPAAVTEARTWQCCCLSVATTVIIASTNREPWALWVPKLPWRQRTPGRIARSAALFVGSTPAWCTKVHSACRRLRISRQVPSSWVSHSFDQLQATVPPPAGSAAYRGQSWHAPACRPAPEATHETSGGPGPSTLPQCRGSARHAQAWLRCRATAGPNRAAAASWATRYRRSSDPSPNTPRSALPNALGPPWRDATAVRQRR